MDYEKVARLRRRVLAPMAEALLGGRSSAPRCVLRLRRRAPRAAGVRPLPGAGDRLGTARHAVIRPARGPGLRAERSAYHLYAQWVAAQQLSVPARAAPLYADLPIGVHPDGFDPLWAPAAFVRGRARGAPPDLFFAGGQDWAFPPLHPERIRDDGYDYFIGVLRRAFRHADYLRVDHIMGLQRLYWIPEGFDARHGAYVSYRADELHAVVSLEAHRAGAVVVGEDLGTVPDGVRARMAADRMLRSWVLQFESTGRTRCRPPSGVLASWGTHDLPRFVSYFWGPTSTRRSAGQLRRPRRRRSAAGAHAGAPRCSGPRCRRRPRPG